MILLAMVIMDIFLYIFYHQGNKMARSKREYMVNYLPCLHEESVNTMHDTNFNGCFNRQYTDKIILAKR